MEIYVYRFLIFYILATIPGILLFILGKKRTGTFFVIVTVISFVGFVFIRSVTLSKAFFISAILLYLIQVSFLIAVLLGNISRRMKASSTGIEIQANGENQKGGYLMELEITWDRAVKIWWSLVWRNLVAILASLILAGIVGGILGFIMGALGVPVKTIQIICAPIGLAIGLAISVVPVKMVLGKDFGEFKLVLLKK